MPENDPEPYVNAIRMDGIGMRFGSVVALRGIDLAVGRNEVVGLIGDNGAGKSPLIKIMTGVLTPTSGRLHVRDKPVDLSKYSVAQAHRFRIETVHQETSLGEKQPLWRNFFVGRQITNLFGFIDVKKEREIADRILKNQIGFRGVGIHADSTVSKLSGGERQSVSIGRAMYFDSDLIILDEPTVALAIKEVQKVLDFVRSIKADGRACLYIDHNLAHVHAVADRMVIIDRGAIVAKGSPWGDPAGQPWSRLGVAVLHSRLYHPQSRGKIERFHRSLTAGVLQLRRLRELDHAQRAFDRWRTIYNLERSHEALGQDVPASRYRPSLRPMPDPIPEATYDAGEIVRRVGTTKAYVSFKGRLWKVPQAFRGEQIAIRPRGPDGQYDICLAAHTIATIDLTNNKPVSHFSEHVSTMSPG